MSDERGGKRGCIGYDSSTWDCLSTVPVRCAALRLLTLETQCERIYSSYIPRLFLA